MQQLSAASPLRGASAIASYGVLKLMPIWDPLRNDPRFQKLCEQSPSQNSKKTTEEV